MLHGQPRIRVQLSAPYRAPCPHGAPPSPRVMHGIITRSTTEVASGVGRAAPPLRGGSHPAGDPPVAAETAVRRHGARGWRRQHEDARPAEIRMGDPWDRRWLLVDARSRDLRALAFC